MNDVEYTNAYFLLTANCNLRCKYCFQEEEYHEQQNAVATKQVVDDFVAFAKQKKLKHVELFGGEPLWDKGIFRYTVNALRQQMPDTDVGFVTNGTLIDEDIMQLLESNPLYVLLSLDGCQERHDAFRGGFTQIRPWFQRLIATGRVTVALQAGMIEGLAEQVRYVWETGFPAVYINVMHNDGWYKPEEIAAFEAEYEQAIVGMLEGKGKLLCATQLHRMFEDSSVDHRCGITGSGLTCDWQGRLFPCHRAQELGREFSIGDIYRGIDTAVEQQLRASIDEGSRQSASASQYPLLSFCPVSAYQQQGTFSGEWPSGFCDLLMTKMKLVAKYHYEIEKHLQPDS